MNFIDKSVIADLRDKTAEMIKDLGLFKDNKECESFSVTRGGAFRCPICGRKLILYRAKDVEDSRWAINSFGRCSHFGRNGEYHGDAIGIYAAVHKISEKDALKKLSSENADENRSSVKQMRIKQKEREIENEKLKANIEENLARCFNDGHWGDDIGEMGKNLLKIRGIDIEKLPSSVKDLIGYINDDGFLGQEGNRYRIEGIAFKLGKQKRSVQIRNTRNNRYITKNDKGLRFLSFGQARPFNIEAIEKSEVLYITEGPFDALSILSLGGNAIASIGAANHGYIQEQLLKVKNKPVIVIAFDTDEAGKRGGLELKKNLDKIPGLKSFCYPLSYQKDFNDLLMDNKEEATERLSLGKALAFCYKKGLINENNILGIIKESNKAYEENRFSEYCESTISKLRAMWKI